MRRIIITVIAVLALTFGTAVAASAQHEPNHNTGACNGGGHPGCSGGGSS